MKELSYTEEWMTFRGTGELQSMYSQWYSEIWAIPPVQALPLRETPPPEQRAFMANIWSTHRVRTLLQESVRRSPLPDWKKTCRNAMRNFWKLQTVWKSITVICRIWNLPLRTESCISYRPEMASARRRRLCRLHATLWMRVWSRPRKLSAELKQNLWISCCIPLSIRMHWKREPWWDRLFLPVRSILLQRKQRKHMRLANVSF